ncbi:suppressor of rasval19 [Malassezia psittaci]|uniref:Adenylyl cyclase-associated protein n=1 Tax=Malassezia psittaci TaxID=1821823 RepID=A0AAF0FFU6_9BASI|nr:suppressor of rasval19 [Malassezia psittaci]
MSSTGIGNLQTLIKRLEAATSRLEDIAMSSDQQATRSAPSMSTESTEPSMQQNEGSASGSEHQQATTTKAKEPALDAWDTSIVPAVKKFMQLSESIGPLTAQQAAMVDDAFQHTRKVIETAANCTKPAQGAADPGFVLLVAPIQTEVQHVLAVREQNRAEKQLFDHLSMVSEGIPAVGWIVVEKTPVSYINDTKDGAQFYANRVLKQHKDGNQTHLEWVRAFLSLLTTLAAYVKSYHPTGLAWNSKGVSLQEYANQQSSAQNAQAKGAMSSSAPPPAPPAPPVDVSAPAAPPAPPAPAAPPSGTLPSSAPIGGMDAVFGQINQGENITQTLRHVDKSQPLSKSADPKKQVPSQTVVPSSESTKLSKKAPIKTLDGNKWTIEKFVQETIVVEPTEINHTINIFACDNCVIEIKGKVNAVSLVSCKKTSILIESVVSSLEITRCQSFTAQITGFTPTILVDNTDGGQVYLSEDSIKTQLTASKSSALNVSVPVLGVPGEYEELALPEQLMHTFGRRENSATCATKVVQHFG